MPFHLATREAMTGVQRVLADDGVYAANLIDYGPLAFARAEVATLGAVFDHVALLGDPDTLARRATTESGGNMVAVASDAPLATDALADRLDERGTGWDVLTGTGLEAWVDGAEVLTDDHAPVDQLLTPYRTVPGVGSD